jgi:hypothetical protein
MDPDTARSGQTPWLEPDPPRDASNIVNHLKAAGFPVAKTTTR